MSKDNEDTIEIDIKRISDIALAKQLLKEEIASLEVRRAKNSVVDARAALEDAKSLVAIREQQHEIAVREGELGTWHYEGDTNDNQT